MENYEVLKELVKFNTIKDKENKEILNYIEEVLLKEGFKTIEKSKNLIMSYGDDIGFGFLGHTDTVEYIDGWNTDPFEVTVKDNKIYGLGVCDMKGGIAAIIDAIKELNLSELKKGIKLYFTYDEEIGFGGIYEIVEKGEKFPNIMIFGEPTDNEALLGSKGLLELDFNFNGIKAHSSNPAKGKSANMNAAKFLVELEEFYNENIKIDLNDKYEVPYTTMNVGIINGGSAKNSVSASCNVFIDFRTIKEEHNEIIKNKLDELKEKYDYTYEIVELVNPFYNDVEFATEKKTAGFMTEASFVSKESDRVILGLGPVTAHEVNEYVTEESYRKLVNQYKEIIEKYCK